MTGMPTEQSSPDYKALGLPTDVADRFIYFANNPWPFLMNCVYTLDQVDQVRPIKTLPDKAYAKLFTKFWLKYPLMAVPKSRRMTMSWFLIALYLWDTLFRAGRFNAFVSKKEDDADELVKRARFILEHIPENMIPKELLPVADPKFGYLGFPSINSKIQGFPQGADQLRQFTFSGILGDECAFWEHAQKFYSATFPTIDGGGRMSLVSSPAPGFFKKLVYDAIDRLGEINVAEYSPDYKRVMPGVRVWRNERNKFLVFELHYSADPLKATDAYRLSIKNSMPLMDYLREYELNWDTFEGYPVYPEFSKLHILEEEPVAEAGSPMLLGLDFGLTPAAVIAQLQGDRLIVFEELVEINMGAVRFVPKLLQHIRLKYPKKDNLRKHWRCFIDPAGFTRHETDESACSMILQENGFDPIGGPQGFEQRRKAVVEWLQKMTPKGPAMQLYARGAPMLHKGFEGGYQFPEKAGEIEPGKIRPLKNAYSHPADAYQYLCGGLAGELASLAKRIPSPSYSFNKPHVPRSGYGLNGRYGIN